MEKRWSLRSKNLFLDIKFLLIENHVMDFIIQKSIFRSKNLDYFMFMH